MGAEDGGTLAKMAVWGGNVKCVETLTALETFDCWNVPDCYGNTPIMRAHLDHRTDLCKILLKCPRVDVNLKNNNEKDLAMMARETDNTEIVKLLEERQC